MISIDVLLVICALMMILGFTESWIMWQFKNILSIIFFSSLGVINWSVVIINICFLLLSMYIFVIKITNKNVHIAITGPGCVGKTTILKKTQLQEFIKNNNFELIDERDYIEGENNYIKSLKGELPFIESQKMFFTNQAKFINDMEVLDKYVGKNVILDRHMVDSFLYGDVLIEEKAITDSKEIKLWKRLKFWNKWFLLTKPKLDLLIIFTVDNYAKIRERRINSAKNGDQRRSLENQHIDLYEKFYNKYNQNEEWYKIAKKISKKIVWIYNVKTPGEVSNELLIELKKAIKNN
ncbi:hypothetical protein H9M94_01910 [Mycoplasma sp. Pen4]|uniref:hypothetical protein n=1 Tax=Mycoplasma sp. Pen4 TaxID=640330 RepID=UPI0016543C95|nr:hypothetical protein [Mycoplasma sp. Pen4]QNM93366.1 hypothetical protein H9M94_01910 [Mycoplasma sp. Pen4]